MKNHYAPWILSVLLILSCHVINEDDHKMYPSDYLFMQRSFPSGKIDQTAYFNALKAREYALENRNFIEGYDDSWIFEGPTNIGGRITDIEMLSNDQNVIFAAAASGGIFRSDDQGQSWNPIFDDAMSLSIGDMAIAQDNQTIYVGTGESNAGGGSLAYDGVGVYKSSDQGNTWQHVGLEQAGSIGKVAIDPNDTERVFVATMGALFAKNDERGVYRTLDGGETWEQVLFLSDSTGAIDLAINPSNPDIIYAAMWERIRTVNDRRYGGPTSGIYRSEDGGESWVELTNGLPSNPSEKGRIGLAIASSNPAILYAYYAEAGGSLQGVYKSEVGGNIWTTMSSENIADVPFIWWFGKIFIDPNDAENVYVASLTMSRSNDGGGSWDGTFDGVHVDQHAIFIHPQNSQLVINGNDGGVYISQNGGDSWIKSNNLPITQFYTCEMDPIDSDHVLGGTQDNGTNRTLTGGEGDWERISGGDGFVVTVDPLNNNIIYAESQNGFLRKSIDRGESFILALNGIENSDRNNWKTPYVLDPSNPSTLYYGTQRLYKSVDRAENWTPISNDLTNGPYPGINTYGTITTISVSPLDRNKIFAGTDDGQVWITEDGGSSFKNISQGIPLRWLTSVQASPYDENAVYATVSGFRFGENKGHVFYSEDNGENWQDISSNLPDIPVNDIIVDPEMDQALYLATDIGVYYSLDNGEVWLLLGTDLPNVPIVDLDYQEGERILVAATYGRSMFSYPLPGNVSVEEYQNLIDVSLYPNPAIDQITIEVQEGLESTLDAELYSLTGKSLMKRKFSSGQRTFVWNIADLNPGNYILIIRGNKFKESLSFVKL